MSSLQMRRLAAVSAVALGMAAATISCGERAKTEAAADKKAEQPGIVVRGDEVTLAEDSPMLSQIKSAVVEMAEVPTEEVDAPGKIEVDPNHVSHVVLPLAGRISSLAVKIGDTLQRGQTLLMLESPDADAAMANYLQAESGINTAKSVVLKAQSDYDRTKDLFEHNAVAQKEVINAESALAQTKTALEVAMTTREQTQRKLDMLGLTRGQFGQKVAVKAPISGKVLELTAAVNEYRNDTNASLMTIADLSSVWVSSDVPETQIRFIEEGERVDLQLEAYPGKEFHAKVMRIADTVDPTTRTIKVHAELANPGQMLRPEMFGRIRQIETVKKLPVVPVAAVVQSDGKDLVYREIGKGKFERVPVQLGLRVNNRVAVLQGLNPGDRIVVDGVMLLKAS
jgi:membrane fusion protein, heavy metal efflux system